MTRPPLAAICSVVAKHFGISAPALRAPVARGRNGSKEAVARSVLTHIACRTYAHPHREVAAFLQVDRRAIQANINTVEDKPERYAAAVACMSALRSGSKRQSETTRKPTDAFDIIAHVPNRTRDTDTRKPWQKDMNIAVNRLENLHRW